MKKEKNKEVEFLKKLRSLKFRQVQIDSIMVFANNNPELSFEYIYDTLMMMKGLSYQHSHKMAEPENEEINSGKVIEEIRGCLKNISGITEISPILSDGYNESRIGKDYTFYTIKNGRKQFTIVVLDNQE